MAKHREVKPGEGDPSSRGVVHHWQQGHIKGEISLVPDEPTATNDYHENHSETRRSSQRSGLDRLRELSQKMALANKKGKPT